MAVEQGVANAGAEVVKTSASQTVPLYTEPSIGLWFFIGALVAVGIYLLVDYIRFRRK